MNTKNFLYISCGTVFLLGLMQSTRILNIFDVKPNLVLAFILASLFFLNFWEYLILTIAGAISLFFFTGPESEIIIFLGLLCLAFVAKKYILGAGIESILILTAAVTSIFYIIFALQTILQTPHIFFQELIYNILFAVAVYLFLDLFYDKIQTQ